MRDYFTTSNPYNGKYEKLFKDMAEQWEKDTYNFQKEELKQLINIEVD